MQNKRLLALMRSQNKAYDILYMEVIIGILPMVRRGVDVYFENTSSVEVFI